MTAIRVPLTALKKKFWLVCENQVNRWQRIKKMYNPMQIILRRIKKAKKLDKTKKMTFAVPYFERISLFPKS